MIALFACTYHIPFIEHKALACVFLAMPNESLKATLRLPSYIFRSYAQNPLTISYSQRANILM